MGILIRRDLRIPVFQPLQWGKLLLQQFLNATVISVTVFFYNANEIYLMLLFRANFRNIVSLVLITPSPLQRNRADVSRVIPFLQNRKSLISICASPVSPADGTSGFHPVKLVFPDFVCNRAHP